MKRPFLAIIFSLIFANMAAEAQFTASLSHNPVSVGERFQVTFTIEGEGKNFRPPDFKGFSVLSGPSQSQSMQIMNGKMSRQLSFTYLLQADSPGDYTIQPAYVESEGKRLQTNAIKVKVLKADAQQQQQQQQQQQGEQNLNQQAQDIISKNVFIELNVSKQNIMQGEQIIATYTLYVHPNLQLVGLKPVKMPVYNGFWMQEIDGEKKLQYVPKVYNGVRYNTAELKKIVLIPQQGGKMSIQPIELECTARLAVRGQRRQRGFMDGFFDDPFSSSYRDFPYIAKSKSIPVTVTPLPQPSPIDFTGGVGELTMQAWLDKTLTKTNVPVTLKVKISGRGNLNLINNININLPPNFESYEPKLVDNISTTGAGISGSRLFEYILLPRNPGDFKIEPVKFGYFDISKKEYVSLSSEELAIKVEKGEDGDYTAVISGVKKEDVQYLGKDIRFIKLNTAGLSKSGNGFFGSAMFYIFNVLPLALFVAFIFWRRKQIQLNNNKALLRNKKATKIARKRLSAAAAYLKSGNRDKFYEETTKALWGYLSDKLSIPVSDLNRDTAQQSLTEHGVGDELISKTLDTVARCEFARYSPAGAGSELENVYDDAVSVISDLEGNLK